MREFKVLDKVLPLLYQRADVAVGPGDDCAAIDLGGNCYLLAAVDQMVCGLHYYPEVAPERIGAKLLKRNLSDVAAMGGFPGHALVSLAAYGNKSKWYEKFFKGLEKEARRWDVSICGGDLSGLPAGKLREVMSLTILGQVSADKICLRENAMPGDYLYATGCFGNSLISEHHLEFTPRLAEGEFLAGTYTRAMLDVSDGLLLDASRMAKASRVLLTLDLESIPLRPGADLVGALGDGEDYELIFAVAPDKCEELEKTWKFSGTRLSRIGVFSKGSGVFDRNGKDLMKMRHTGYEHRSI